MPVLRLMAEILSSGHDPTMHCNKLQFVRIKLLDSFPLKDTDFKSETIKHESFVKIETCLVVQKCPLSFCFKVSVQCGPNLLFFSRNDSCCLNM